jgi:hypothetical protein
MIHQKLVWYKSKQNEKREECRLLGGMWGLVGILLTEQVHRLWISYTLKMETISSSETSVNKISTRRHISEDGILHSHRRENLKSHRMKNNCDPSTCAQTTN